MLIDSSAWIAYFEGESGGSRVGEVLEMGGSYTCSESVAEIVYWALRKGKEIAYIIAKIEDFSVLIYPDKAIIVHAAKLNYERKIVKGKWGIMDSFVLATAAAYELKILTKDSDFNDLENVEML